MPLHKHVTLENNHKPQRWEFSTHAELSSFVPDSIDALKVALVREDESYHLLTSTSPVAWKQVTVNKDMLTQLLALKVDIANIVDNLTSTDTNKPLSANQGKILLGYIENINTILASDDTNLDEIQEIVDFIKANKNDIVTHIARTDNPHSVTASQVGAYTKAEADAIHESQVTNSVGQSVSFFLGDTIVNGDNYDLTNFPDSDLEQAIVETAVTANTPYFIERYITQPLGGLKIDGGAWWFRTYGAVNNNTGISEIITRVNRRTIKTGTITITGTGLTRTVTATDAIFAPTDANTSILNSSLIETPTDTFWISSYISPTQVTVTLESNTYVNETNAPFYMYYKLFEVSTGEINGATPKLYEVSTTQPSFNILATDSILLAYFAVTTSTNKTLSLYKGGTQHYSHVVTPLVYRHNALSGLNEGNYRHLSEVEKTYFDTIPTLLDNKVDKVTGKQLSTNDLTNELLTLLTTKKVKNVTTDALNDKLVITYTDDTTSELNINDIVTDVHVSGASLDATTNVLTLTSTDGGADVTVNLSDFVNSSELATALNTKVTKVTSTDNAIVRFNGTTGDVQNSGVIIDDSGNVILNTTELNPTIKITTSGTTTQNTISTLDLTARGSNNAFNNVDIQSIGTNSLGGTLIFRTDNTSGDITERMRIDSAGKLTQNGFTKLGSDAPAIKYKKITGRTALTQGGETHVPHGIDGSKILFASMLIDYTGNGNGDLLQEKELILDGWYAQLYTTKTHIIVRNAGGTFKFSSTNILNKPFTVLITYSE